MSRYVTEVIKAFPLLISVAASAPLHAAEDWPAERGEPFSLEAITVTGDRIPRPEWEPLRHVYAPPDRLPTSFNSSPRGAGDPSNPGDTPYREDRVSSRDPCDYAGNPVVIASGNKFEIDVDFESASVFGLVLKRTYNGMGTGRGIFGANV